MTSQTCVTKNPATGMGVRISEDSSGNTCDVLGSFSDDFAEWTPLLEDDTGDFIGLQLNGGNGSPCQAGGSHPVEPTPYLLVTNFNCYVGNPKDRIKASPAGTAFVASSGSGCSPIFQINTCLACADGCSLPLSPSAGSGGGGVGWFGWLLIVVFLILTPAYIIGGYVIQKRILPPFDRCVPESRRTSQEVGGDYSVAQGTTYGAVSDSI